MQIDTKNFQSDINPETAKRAFYNVSFRPEKRGEQAVGHYNEIVLRIADAVIDQCKTPEQQAIAQETFDKLYTRFKRLFEDWLSAQGRCLSSVITGPANFPVRRAEKANTSEHNKMQRVLWFGDNIEKMVTKQLRKLVTPQQAQADDIAKLERNIKADTKRQAFMKAANKAYRAYIKKPEDAEKIFHGFTAAEQEVIKDWQPQYRYERAPFAPYQMQNNLANIKRMQERLAQLKAKQEKAETVGTKSHDFGGFRVVENYEEDRLQLFFDGKPEAEVRDALKAHGYRWSPRNAAWQRKLTNNAIYSFKNHLMQCPAIKLLTQ